MQLQTKSKIENIILMFSVSWFLFSNWHKLSLSLSLSATWTKTPQIVWGSVDVNSTMVLGLT